MKDHRNHENLEIREVCPDEKVVHILKDNELDLFNQLQNVREEHNKLIRKLERMSKKYNSLTELLWSEIHDALGDEYEDDSLLICTRGEEHVVVPAGNASDDCECPVCQMKRAGVDLSGVKDFLSGLFGDGDKDKGIM